MWQPLIFYIMIRSPGKRRKKWENNREFDEVLRRKISETLDEPIDEGVDADDLMFDLGMRYLRLKAAEKKKRASKKANQLSLCCHGQQAV